MKVATTVELDDMLELEGVKAVRVLGLCEPPPLGQHWGIRMELYEDGEDAVEETEAHCRQSA